MPHVILLGDSIFDNARYVPGGPAVLEHLQRLLPADWRATLLARDGAVTTSLDRQVDHLPDDATHLVLSVGGNNALDHAGFIAGEPASSFVQVLTEMAEIRATFQREYQECLRQLLGRGLPLAVCTVYDAIPDLTAAELTGLCLFNDVILREAFRGGLPVLDLRLICTERTDYAQSSPIEPSASGGGKIARAITRWLTGNKPFRGSCVWGGD